MKISDESKVAAYNKYMEDWYVVCSTSGEKIPVNDLRYWNVETQKVYASAEMVPMRAQPLNS